MAALVPASLVWLESGQLNDHGNVMGMFVLLSSNFVITGK